jgi:hypothetical protein
MSQRAVDVLLKYSIDRFLGKELYVFRSMNGDSIFFKQKKMQINIFLESDYSLNNFLENF